MCSGVTKGFAKIKLSLSPKIYGQNEIIKIKIINKNINPIKSLILKNGLNAIFFIFLLMPKGLFDPVICKKNKCIIVIAIIINGNKK